MAISRAWTDPDTLEVAATEIRRAADINAQLGNLKWLHAPPRFTLAHTANQTIAADTDTTLTWDTEIEDVGGWFDSGSPTVAVVPETGLYMITVNVLWDINAGGNYRRVRLARDGDLVRGDSRFGHVYTEHSMSILSSMSAGQALSVSVRHDDSTQSHDVESWSTPAWRSPLFMGVRLSPYSQDI